MDTSSHSTRTWLSLYAWVFGLTGMVFVAAAAPLTELLSFASRWIPGGAPLPGAEPSLWLGLTGSLMAVLTGLAASLARDPSQGLAWSLVILSKGMSTLLFAAFGAVEGNATFLIGSAVDGAIMLHFIALRGRVFSRLDLSLVSKFPPAGPFYEVWFAKANDPKTRSAAWVRYTLSRGAGAGSAACWYVLFDAPAKRIVSGRWERPLSEAARGEASPFLLGGSLVEEGRLVGRGPDASWDLAWTGGRAPGFSFVPPALGASGLLPSGYAAPVSHGLFSGALRAGGVELRLDKAPGSVGHLWGPRMALDWRWAHAVLEGPDGTSSVFELLTARIKLGPFSSPELTTANLWHGGRHHRSVGLVKALSNASRRDGDRWAFKIGFGDLSAEGECAVDPELSVTLPYQSPDGRRLACRNSKTGSLRLTLSALGRDVATLATRDQAAVEFAGPEEEP